MEARLVAMIIQSLQTGKGSDLRATAEDQLAGNSKDTVETLIENIGSDLADQAFRIMRHIERVLPGISFLETAPHLHRIEVINETSISLLRMNKISGRIIDTLPAFRQPHQFIIVVSLTQFLCPLSDCPGTVRIF